MKNIVTLLLLSVVTLDQIKAETAKTNSTLIGADELIHGRNTAGKFKNHEHYLQVLQQLNSAESKNQEMFDGITKQLQDNEFIRMEANQNEAENDPDQVTINDGDTEPSTEANMMTTVESTAYSRETSGMSDEEADAYLRRYPDVGNIGNRVAARKHWVDYGRKEGRNKAVDGDLSNEEVICYKDFYDDTEQQWAVTMKSQPLTKKQEWIRNHWNTKGKKEGRHGKCATRITKQESLCYLNRYPDLRKAFGWNTKSWIKAQNHWYTNGAKEGRNYVCENETFHCGDQEKNNMCQCPAGATILYVNKYNNGLTPPKGQVASLRQGLRYGHHTFITYSSSTRCSNSLLGNALHGLWKQCFCEPKQNLPPIQIAEEGETNIIPKVKDRYVYYGRLEKGSGTLSFREMVREPFLRTNKLIPPAPERKGYDYRGKQFLTKSGRLCQKWDDQSPHKHTRGPKWRHNVGVDGGHNYCRNPDREGATIWCYTTDPKKRWEYCDPEPLDCTHASLGLKDPLPGIRKQCYYDDNNYYSSDSFKKDQEALDARAKAEESLKLVKEQNERAELAERRSFQAKAALIAARAKAERERLAAIAESRRNWMQKQAESLENEKAARESAYKKLLKRQDRAQARRLKAQRLRFQARKAQRMWRRAQKAKRRSNEIDRVKLAIEAHMRKAQMLEKLQQAKMMQNAADAAEKKAQMQQELAEKKIAAAAVKAQLDMVNSKNDEVAQAAADAAKLKAQEQAAAEKAAAEEAEQKRQQAAVQKGIQNAIDEFNRKQKEKAEREAAEEAEELRKKQEAARKKAREEAEEAERQRQAKEEARRQYEAAKAAKIAAEEKAAQDLKNKDAEERRLKLEQMAAEEAQAAATQRAVEAQKAAALASSQDARDKAQAEADAAAKEVEAAEARKKKMEEDKAALESQREENERKIAEAKAAAEASAEAQKEAEEKAAKWEAEEKATRERTEAEEAAARAAAQAETDRIQAEYEANQKRRDEAAAAQALAIKIADEAAQKAHEEAQAKRKEQEERQAADLAAKMLKRQNKFKAQYEHVWFTGPPGISMINLHVPDNNVAELLLEVLFYDNLIADCEIIQNNIHRSYLVDGKIVTEDGDHQMYMMTSDERLDDALKRISEKIQNPQFDAMVTVPSTGNKNYINWVKQQTVVPDHLKKTED